MELKIGDKIDIDTGRGKYVATVEKFDYDGRAAIAYTDKRKRFVLNRVQQNEKELEGFYDCVIRTRIQYRLHVIRGSTY